MRDIEDIITASEIADTALIRCTPTDWMKHHDAKMRDDALDEAAVCAESAASDDNKYSIAESIRAMKGAKE